MSNHLEDLTPGRIFRSPAYTVTPETIKEFASRYDPQHFHLDEESAKDSFFEGLAASGWHTAAVTMRLMVTGELDLALGVIGAGVESIKWHRPVRPGDVLTTESRVLETRIMKSRPGLGLARFEVVTLDAERLPVQTMRTSLIVPCRGSSLREV
jgi:acyl dehydratase